LVIGQLVHFPRLIFQREGRSFLARIDEWHGYIKSQIPNPKDAGRDNGATLQRIVRMIVATIFTSSLAIRKRNLVSFNSRRTMRSFARKSRSLDASSDSSMFDAAEEAAVAICNENALAIPPWRCTFSIARVTSHANRRVLSRITPNATHQNDWNLGSGIWVLGFTQRP